MEKFDAIIIGAGSAGLGCLGMAKKLGWKALIIDKEESNIGGDCLNFGCVPSKAIIQVAKYFHGAKEAAKFGLKSEGKADLQKVLQYVYDKQAIIRAHESADYLRSNGEHLEIGEAKFKDEHTIIVGEREFYGERIFICTGSHPRHIPFAGIDQVPHYNNESLFYELKELPNRFLVVGGGPIGCEMAQVFCRLGSKVTILERGDRILSKEREEMSEILTTRLKQEGIEILTGHDLKSFEGKNTAKIQNRASEVDSTVEFDAVLMAIGRGLNHSSLNIQNANIEETERGRIVINDYLQTKQSHIYVVGDAAGMYQFSHGAEKHVKLLSHNFDSFLKRKHHVKDLSWVTFTDPEVASFGLTEAYLKEHNIKYWRQDQSLHKDDRAITANYDYGSMTLFVTTDKIKSRRKILGGSIIAPYAGEIMQELHLACVADICLNDFMEKIYAYPTASRINQQTIMGIIGN